jgi:cobalt/nickel transport system permease protein
VHIPDGFINAPTAVATAGVGVAVVAKALRVAKEQLDDRQVPLVGVTAAFVFAAQMLNFPIGLGTSGHLIGGTLAAILLGPWIGALVVAVVLIVQALLFADGGITALGANVTLMSLVGGVGGYALFRTLLHFAPRTRTGFLGSTAVASWGAVVGASALCSVFLMLNGFPAATLPVMVGLHSLIGIGEAVVTVAVVAAVLAVRPDLMSTRDLVPVTAPEALV